MQDTYIGYFTHGILHTALRTRQTIHGTPHSALVVLHIRGTPHTVLHSRYSLNCTPHTVLHTYCVIPHTRYSTNDNPPHSTVLYPPYSTHGIPYSTPNDAPPTVIHKRNYSFLPRLRNTVYVINLFQVRVINRHCTLHSMYCVCFALTQTCVFPGTCYLPLAQKV
jgi:hypothetical protein